MYIVPQTVFKIIRDVPFNNDYKHTIWFTDASAQLTYFNSKVAYSFTDFTYVRKERVVRVPVCADDIYNCNYCMFQNAGFGNKWFFGFITNIEYANNDVSMLTIEIDYLQTWLLDFHFNTSFVEREHVADDTFGLHTVDENLPLGGFVEVEHWFKTYNAGVAVYVLADSYGDGSINNVCTFLEGAGAVISSSQSMQQLIDTILEPLIDQPEKIANVTMCADEMVNASTNALHGFEEPFTLTRNNTDFKWKADTYRPKNNKLLGYPYQFLSVDNFNGQSEVYKWENFNYLDMYGHHAEFNVNGVINPKPAIELIPIQYNILDTEFVYKDNSYSIQFDAFPLVPFLIDNYRAWASADLPKAINNINAAIDTREISNITSAVIGVAGTTAGIVTGNGFAGGAGAMALVNQLPTELKGNININTQKENLQIDINYHKLHNMSMGGSIGSSGLNFSRNRIGFHFRAMAIKPEYARICDDFLTRFGYKVNRYKIPELTSRQSFNFVKTVDCNIGGNIPNEANTALCNIFNNGITLWHTVNVGNYSLNNNIVGE